MSHSGKLVMKAKMTTQSRRNRAEWLRREAAILDHLHPVEYGTVGNVQVNEPIEIAGGSVLKFLRHYLPCRIVVSYLCLGEQG
jgi:hypothetical protein